MIKHLNVYLLLGLCLSEIGRANPTVLSLCPDRRLKAAIAQDSMNRIAVTNDRITQVFGDEESYVVQAEEHTGQLFLKPTVENGDKPLSLTLITESGLTQDLTLEPTKKEATTLLLKATSLTTSQRSLERRGGLGHPSIYEQAFKDDNPGSSAEQYVQAIKLMVSGQALSAEGEGASRTKPAGFEVNWKQSYNLTSLKGYQYEVKNTTDTSIELQEKSFIKRGT
jgi:type-F conjugative transfer system secretin TraK